MRADHARSGIVGVSGSGRWCSHRAVPRNHRCCDWRPRHALSPRNHVQSTIMNFPLLVPILILLSDCINSSSFFLAAIFCAHFCTAKTRHLRCGIYTHPSVTVDRRQL